MWFDPVLYVMVVPVLAAHALMGISIRNPLFSSDSSCMIIIYSFTLRDRRLCLFASISHFGRCRHCYSGALLSGSGHCCPFRVRAPVDFHQGRLIIRLRGFVLFQGVSERWPLTWPIVIVISVISENIHVNARKYNFLKHSMWVTDDYLVKFTPVTSNYLE